MKCVACIAMAVFLSYGVLVNILRLDCVLGPFPWISDFWADSARPVPVSKMSLRFTPLLMRRSSGTSN
jgi:hypothetical protein